MRKDYKLKEYMENPPTPDCLEIKKEYFGVVKLFDLIIDPKQVEANYGDWLERNEPRIQELVNEIVPTKSKFVDYTGGLMWSSVPPKKF